MDYSDDDISASDDDQAMHAENDMDAEEIDDTASEEDGADPTAAQPAPGTAAAVAAGGSHANAAADKAIVQATQDALLGGEMSTNAALLQLLLNDLLAGAALSKQPHLQTAVEGLVRQLADALASTPARVLAAEADEGLAAMISSWGLNPQEVSCSVSRPVSVQLVGSWATQSAAQLAGAAVDVAVQMPPAALHHKDILNYRYHAKRAGYMSALSQHLAVHPVFRSAVQQFAPFNGDPCKPILLLHLNPKTLAKALQQQGLAPAAATGFGAEGLVIRLLPVVGLDAFEFSKLAPDRNNVRWVMTNSSSSRGSESKPAQQQQQVGQQQQQLPTPHYNASILQDMLLLVGQQQLQRTVSLGGSRFTDALTLFKIWAQQQALTTQGVLPADSKACYAGSSSSSSAGLAAAAGAAASPYDGFSGYLLAQLLAAAVAQAGPAAAAAMSPVQQLRCVLQLLADKQTWAKGGLALPRDNAAPAELRLQQHQQDSAAAAAPVAGKISKDQVKLTQKLQLQLQQLPPPAVSSAAFKKAYDIVVLDPSGHLNLAACVSKSTVQLAQLAARRSLDILNRQDLEPDMVYGAVFRPGQGLAGVFDYWWTVELPEQQQQQLGGDQHHMRVEEVQVEGLVRQALTTRAVLVKAIRRPPSYLPQQQQQQQQQQHKSAKHTAAAAAAAAAGAVGVPKRIVVGVLMDAVKALRAVDVGPAADDAAAAATFRALWGDKSELRRFQDGKINEALVWEGVPPGERHRIPDLAVQHLLLRHLPGGTTVQSCSTALDVLLYPGSSAGSTSSKTLVGEALTWTAVQPAAGSTGGAGSTMSTAVAVGGSSGGAAAAATAASRAADTALDALGKQLRSLSDVALKVIGVQPVSAVNRHTACFYPKPHPLAEGTGVVLGGVEVPRVLEPIEVVVQLEGSGRMPSDPTAFAKTKAALGVQLATALAAACGAYVAASEEAVEVLWQGFAFKLLLYMDRDQSMLAAAAAGSSMPLPLLLSRHHGMIAAVDAAHAAYGPTVRLAKRWIGLQLLLGPTQVCEEAVELLVAAVFQGPATIPPPASRISGFLRFLQLLSQHPWSAVPLLVDPQGEVGAAGRSQLQRHFEARRSAGGTLPGMFIAAPYDLSGSRWTAHHPTPAVTHHLVSLARTAADQLSQLLLLGPDAPTAQQQLLLLTKQQAKKKPKTAAAAAAAATKRDTLQQQQQQQQCMTALARAWRAATGPNFAGFDAWIVLRAEALPFAFRADPLAAATLQQQLKQQRRKQEQLLLAGQQEDEQEGKSGKRSRKESQIAAAAAAAAAAAGGALRQLLAGVHSCDAPKASRAVLRNIPEQVCQTKPVEKLRAELLVGFEPVTSFLQLCNERYSHVATFCADPLGGFAAVGVKWRPEAFLPGPLKPNHAHGMMELSVTCAAGKSEKAGRKGEKGVRQGRSTHVGLVVPNVGQILGEICEMGLGLVQEVVLLG